MLGMSDLWPWHSCLAHEKEEEGVTEKKEDDEDEDVDAETEEKEEGGGGGAVGGRPVPGISRQATLLQIVCDKY